MQEKEISANPVSEINGSQVKVESKIADIDFIPARGINSKHITFIGRKYTRRQFVLMLKLMQKGLFLYPDELIKNEDTPDLETESVKGWVIVRSFLPVNDLKDPRLVALTDDISDIDDDFIKNIKFRHSTDYNFKRVITHDFVDMVSFAMRYDLIPNDWRNLTTSVKDKWAKRLTGYDTVPIEYIERDDLYALLIKEINKVFNIIRHNQYCMICDTFANTKRVKYIQRKQGNKELSLTEDNFKEEEIVRHAYACSACCTKVGIANRLVSDKIQRNEPCTCGSGKKYKRCCGK